MIFPYLKITPQIKRPIVPIIMTSKERFITYSALIDSGADWCVFSIELAKALGIALSPRRPIRFIGIGKDELRGYWGKVDARVGNVNFKIKAIFADISDFGHGILGQKGFFDIFVVKFDLVKEEIELKPR